MKDDKIMSCMTNYNKNKNWALICGAWGDILCSLNNVYTYNIKNIIYIGDMNLIDIKNFLSFQKNIHNIIAINNKDLGLNYEDYIFKVLAYIIPRRPEADYVIETILKHQNINIDVKDIFNASWDPNSIYFPTQQARNLILSSEINAWADEFITTHNLFDYVLINPYSLHSRKLDNHWPHTEEYIDWLVHSYSNKFIFVGIDYNPIKYKMHYNIIDAHNTTPSMMHVYALANKASFIITCSNSLSHWCNANDLSSIILCNYEVSEHNNFYGRILTSTKLKKIYFQDQMKTAKHFAKISIY